MALTRFPAFPAFPAISRRVRPLVATAAVIGTVAALLVPTVASATPDPGQPQTVETVTAKLDTLSRQNEALTEKYNQAQAEVVQTQRAADAARKAALQAAADLQTAQAQLDRTLAAQYEGSAFSATGALLTSQNGDNYLAKLSSLNLLSEHRADVIAQVQRAQQQASKADETAAALLDQAKHDRDAIAKQRNQIVTDTANYKNLLATLTIAQQTAYRNRNAVVNTPAQAATIKVHAGNAAAQKAVNYALAQVGKAYVFAGTGPNAYDCSGLTMMAWAQAGVSLPHLASAQYNYGTHVSASQLQPGDLIFLYSPIDHVEIYIGNGLAVSAADEAEGIVIVNIARDMSDWAGATRLT